jgi:Ion channel
VLAGRGRVARRSGDFHSTWDGIWWAVQTVTTVGYGDLTVTTVEGRIIAMVVMVFGIGFLSDPDGDGRLPLRQDRARRRDRGDPGGACEARGGVGRAEAAARPALLIAASLHHGAVRLVELSGPTSGEKPELASASREPCVRSSKSAAPRGRSARAVVACSRRVSGLALNSCQVTNPRRADR